MTDVFTALLEKKGEIEAAVRAGIADGKIPGTGALGAKVTLTLDGVDLSVDIDGVIELE